MREERQVRLLSLVDVLQPLTEEELRDLARRCPDMRLDAGQDFYRPETHDGGLFLIKEGRVRVYTTTPSGKETILELLGGGTVLWARRFEALQTHGVHAQATEPSVVAFMDRNALDRFILAKPDVGLKMMDLLAERLGSTSERMAEVANKEVTSRLASQILRLLYSEGVVDPEGGQRLPSAYTHEELGAMIGSGRVAVTRAFGALREEGTVELVSRRIHVKDPERLRSIAERER